MKVIQKPILPFYYPSTSIIKQQKVINTTNIGVKGIQPVYWSKCFDTLTILLPKITLKSDVHIDDYY